jgi:hypothetical protein
MTRVSKNTVRCTLCGSSQEVLELCSTSTWGAPDLDTRPAPLARANLALEVQRCEHCGYCASALSAPPGEAASVVSSGDYRVRLSDAAFPELARSFRCAALVLEDAGDLAGAGWCSLKAAWVCDDQGDDGRASICRRQTIALFAAARSANQRFAEDRASEDAIRVDVLRRSGQLGDADELCRESLRTNPGEQVSTMLRFQRALIERSNTARFTLDEARDYAGDSGSDSGQAPTGIP